MAEDQGPIRNETNFAVTGLNLDQTDSQIQKGKLTYALNAAVENFDGNSVNYQNEAGNVFCLQFPAGYQDIGNHAIIEKGKHIFFLANPGTGDSEIGYMDNNDCIYHTLINDPCLNFNINFPVRKIVHKITNCTTEIYWTDGYNSRRYLDLDNIPYMLTIDATLCDPDFTDVLDCNQLKVQPNFPIPGLSVTDVISGGETPAGTYQFAVQYADAASNDYTSYYSVTNPTPIADTRITTPNFNYPVGKSIVITVDNLDYTGHFQYFNLAVIKTINDITSVELVGTYFIDQPTMEIIYTGQSMTQIRLSIADIFEKYPYYDIAQDLTAVQDVLVWDQLSSIDRINYQAIASLVDLKWETYRIPANENYADEINATNLRGYLRDEIYSFELIFLLKKGKQTDGFHIPGRPFGVYDNFPDVPDTNPDFIGEPDYIDPLTGVGYSAYWKIYNTAVVIGPAVGDNIGNATPYQYGEFAFWESAEEYPCNQDLWGPLAGQKIRHHKMPDVLVSPIFESNFISTADMVMEDEAVFPLGVKIDALQLRSLINGSNLTTEQKADIAGFKIVRGNRDTNKSIIGKGILRNVATYQREEQSFYYANYPYNDLHEDPFILESTNAYSVLGQTDVWMVEARQLDGATGKLEYEYTNPDTGLTATGFLTFVGEVAEFCSLTRPIFKNGIAAIGPANYDVAIIPPGVVFDQAYLGRALSTWSVNNDPSTLLLLGPIDPAIQIFPIYARKLAVGGLPYGIDGDGNIVYNPAPGSYTNVFQTVPLGTYPVDVGPNSYERGVNIGRRSMLKCSQEPLPPIDTDSSRYRQVLNSPETSFGQPFLGDILKLENVMFGKGKAHFVKVKDNAKYRLLSKEAQQDALDSSFTIAAGNTTAIFTAYQAYLQIYVNGITRKNYAHSFNSVMSYNYSAEIQNNLGIKQRPVDLAQYLIPGVQNVGDNFNINNYQRESSVYLRAKGALNNSVTPLPFPSDTPSLAGTGVEDMSRHTISMKENCSTPEKEEDITSVVYYASLKNIFVNQWGQLYSYNTIDTGFQKEFNAALPQDNAIFGGDTFISRFAFKTKLPFFIDNRVNAPDDSDIFYDEIGNIAYPKYWHSARSILYNYGGMTNIISIKAHNFDCPTDPASIPKTPDGPSGTYRTYYDGKFYLFAYGIPSFYCESSYNVDLRQAFNNKEGDFWPHVSTGIPDDWVQESFVSIANDNSYYYNVTFSKQNRENIFTHLPPDWEDKLCYTHYPFRAIYSDSQEKNADNRVNNWLSYGATSLFDFPQNYGKLISLDGIQNKAVLARFENKSLLYNTLLTVNTSNPQAAYLGNSSLFSSSPPIDFAETDLGYVGCQNRMLLKIPEGQITVDAKRGQIFLINGIGGKIDELSKFGSGLNRFFTDHLPFKILKNFPTVDTDNNFTGIGLHGVYDSKFNRVIITKLDYEPIDPDVRYDEETKEYYVEYTAENETVFRTQVFLSDSEYFCNRSWTLSFNMNTGSWISFHSYLPNWYIGENNFFYSGINGCCDDTEINFSALIGVMDKGSITTTTTTTIAMTTSSTTTPKPLECELEGEVMVTECELEGEAVITIPASTTTTTTFCNRPVGLTEFQFIQSYKFNTDPKVTVTGSKIDACNAIDPIYEIEDGTTPGVVTTFTVYVNLLDIVTFKPAVGEFVYDTNIPLCTYIPDGWYFIYQSDFELYLYHVVSGCIVEITDCNPPTTTTTTTTV